MTIFFILFALIANGQKNSTLEKDKVDSITIHYLNKYRKLNGVKPVQYSSKIKKISYEHIQTMIERNDYDHPRVYYSNENINSLGDMNNGNVPIYSDFKFIEELEAMGFTIKSAKHTSISYKNGKTVKDIKVEDLIKVCISDELIAFSKELDYDIEKFNVLDFNEDDDEYLEFLIVNSIYSLSKSYYHNKNMIKPDVKYFSTAYINNTRIEYFNLSNTILGAWVLVMNFQKDEYLNKVE